MTDSPTAALVTLGCARNDVDAEELAARLRADGWSLTDDPDGGDADVVIINTCGFVTEAKQESIDTVLAAADSGRAVVAVGCLAERYGAELAEQLPEAAAVIGFDGYADIGDRLRRVLAGESLPAHTPVDRRTLLPITPVARPGIQHPPGHAVTTGLRLPDTPLRHRLHDGPVAPLKIASGCDRRCTFCAIPRFRGSFLSRPPADVLAEAAWLADQGVREVVLVSENSTSYGKDLRDPRALEKLLPALAEVPGIRRIRVAYLQPAELRPGLLDVIAATPGVAPYFDLSFQHASGSVLRRMRRFGDRTSFLDLIGRIRDRAPQAGIRSNVIVGFPGETDEELADLERFLADAELDAVGVFGYSGEDGTEAAGLPGALDPDTIAERVARVAVLADTTAAGRAAARVGDRGTLLVESVGADGVRGRLEWQGPDDGDTLVAAAAAGPGDLLEVLVTASDGVDLLAALADTP